ncbi:MAG: hypothetical protein WCG75_03805 [Armatimonadota bacterium]
MSDPNLLPLLQKLVDKVVAPYAKMPQTRAILSIGSVSYGIVDKSSDIDIALYYDELPSDEQLTDAMIQNGAEKLNWQIGSRAEGGLIDSYMVYGVECQFAHTTLAAMDHDMDSILVDLDVDNPFQKALSGVMAGVTIMGDDLIQQYKLRASNYPEALQTAMVNRFMNFQPLWAIEDRMSVRDAELWRMQALVEGSYNLLGVLAGLNRLYYSSFQFKRMHAFVDQMQWKPQDLANRITSVFKGHPNASQEFRSLVAETVALVEQHMPTIDTTVVHTRLNREVHRWNPQTLSNGLNR